MNNYLLLLCVSTFPAVMSIVITRPLWRLRYLRNEDIHFIGLIAITVTVLCMLIATVMITAFTSNWIIGLLCAPASMINMVFFDLYNLHLHISRCPHCHQRTLRTHAVENGIYRLHCQKCGILTEWRR